MKPRQTITKESKRFIIRAAIFFDCFALTLGWIPIVGWLGAATWAVILFWWLWSQDGRVRDEWKYIFGLYVFQIAELLLTSFPFIGSFVDIALKFAITVNIVLLIKKVEKEDEEYNKKQGLA